jgi:hypothetical protein
MQPSAGASPLVADQDIHPRGLRPRARPDLGAVGRVRHRQPRVGPQPGSHRRRPPDPRWGAGACMPRRWRSTDSSTTSRTAIRAWRSSCVHPAARGSIWGSLNGAIGSGCRTASTPCSASRSTGARSNGSTPELVGSHVASPHWHSACRCALLEPGAPAWWGDRTKSPASEPEMGSCFPAAS